MRIFSFAGTAVLFLSVWAAAAGAGSLKLDGHSEQGGLMVGRTDPGTEVTFDGHKIRVSPAGDSSSASPAMPDPQRCSNCAIRTAACAGRRCP